MKLIGKLVALSLLLSAVQLNAQNQFVVYLSDGTATTYDFQGGTVKFTDNSMIVAHESGSATIALADIAKAVFHLPASVGEAEVNAVSVFPNPAGDWIRIQNASGLVRFFSLDGSLVKTAYADSDEPVRIDGLKSGVYLLSVDNKVVKFIKR